MRLIPIVCCGCLLYGCAPPRPHVAGASPTAGGAPRTRVVVYSPHGREVLEPAKARFEADNPGYEMVPVDMGAQEVLDRLRAERAAPQADVWWGAAHTTFQQGAEEGLLDPYQPTWAAALDASRRDPQHRWYGLYLTPGVIVYNTDAASAADAPRDWDDLLAPQWKGRILVRDPLNSDTMRTFIAAMLLRAPTLDDGWAWLRRLDANTAAYPASPALLFRQFQAQEGVITPWNLRDVFIQRRDHGYRLWALLMLELWHIQF